MKYSKDLYRLLSFRLKDKYYNKLIKLSKKINKTVSQTLRKIVEDYFNLFGEK